MARIVGPIDTIEYEANTDEFAKTQTELNGLFEADIRWRQTARQMFSKVFTVGLVAQNAFVYYLTWDVLHRTSDLANFQLVLSVLIAGTIGQTVGVIQIMVKWIFSDINYNIPNRR